MCGRDEWSVGLCLEYVEYDVHRKAWSFLDLAAEDDPILAAVIVESEAEVGDVHSHHSHVYAFLLVSFKPLATNS